MLDAAVKSTPQAQVNLAFLSLKVDARQKRSNDFVRGAPDSFFAITLSEIIARDGTYEGCATLCCETNAARNSDKRLARLMWFSSRESRAFAQVGRH
jgi:hypothetical protein